MDTAVAGKAGVRVGCDIGGTFTDIVMSMPDGRIFVNKTSTTPGNLGQAIVQGLGALIEQAGIRPGDIGEIVHGTTTASNTILQKVGANTAVLTTEGFRDVLEIGRIRTPTMFDLAWQKPDPLVPRRYRRGIRERIGADGKIVTPLKLEEVRGVVRELAAEGIESIAICFLNSYINPAHEIAARDVIETEFPGILVSASCDVLPEIKEYERTSTTVVNAYILPAMRTYLARLKADLADMGVTASLQVMASNGGMMGVASATQRPVFAVASGPAGGVAGAAVMGALGGEHELIVFDMGGTTAKASIVIDGVPALTTEYEFRDGISASSRFVKGGGYVLKVPAIDIAEVGAGGGSIASIDAGGLLCVGPESAGAWPGPACYGNGSLRPTVTDANMVLGYLNPHALAGGSLKVDPRLSQRAVLEDIGRPLGLNAIQAAHGIRRVANVNMARAMRAVTIERGRDPRDMTMIAFGGGGPLHAVDVARLLGVKRVIAPVMAGVFCSAGMLSADAEHCFVKAVLRPLDDCDGAAVQDAINALCDQGRAVLGTEGYGNDAVDVQVSADLRYLGQSSELTVPLTGGFTDAGVQAALAQDFNALYERTFGYCSDEPLELVNVRVFAYGRSALRLDFAQSGVDSSALAGVSGERHVSFDPDEEPCLARLMPRSDMTPTPVSGPLIIESYDTTIVVPPDARAWSDAIGNIIIELVSEAL
ncbi:hydantoinase/oxoprolinase family protein [Achromobacter seleniivolatilans]|uniref:Hydantoinase/oxoprolinase family protein n=1 Tax=Achromobacter seleniivolatilans TaxID=3047478 RepID=A0ABY9M217_9BURK|nr:hydantoinase/oxoprolinase family protein [Achromobacter sp. R39]WMD21039.1 hydantoinase/oxoprolinase family protein [Achromobacter sp. R39]